MPKKQPHNGFYYFMKELMPQLKAEGVYVRGIPSVVPIAHPRWKLLPPHEKEYYEQMAREMRNKVAPRVTTNPKKKKANENRMDNVGNLLSERVNETELFSHRLADETEHLSLSWPASKEDLLEKRYIFASLEILVEVHPDIYMPREIGLVEFSFKEGITREFHRIIDPGPIPLGYRLKAQQQCDEVHNIPLQFEDAENDYKKLWKDIVDFINPDDSYPYPPIFVMEKNLKAFEGGVDWLYLHTKPGEDQGPSKVNVFVLENLIQMIYQSTNRTISTSTVTHIITACTWDYMPNTRCTFHEDNGLRVCALFTCNVFCYAISDALSEPLGFDITAKHLPTISECTAVQMNVNIGYRSTFDTESSRNKLRRHRGAGFPSRDVRYTEVPSLMSAEYDTNSEVSGNTYTAGTSRSMYSSGVSSVHNPWEDNQASEHSRQSNVRRPAGLGRGTSVNFAPPTLNRDDYPRIGGLSSDSSVSSLTDRFSNVNIGKMQKM